MNFLIHGMKTELCAGAVVYRLHNGAVQFLLLRDRKGYWLAPKGHLEGTETPKECARREVFEETGIVVDSFEQNFQHSIEYTFKLQDEQRLKIVTFYLVDGGSQPVNVSHEHAESRWFDVDDAIQMIGLDEGRKLLRAANSFLVTK